MQRDEPPDAQLRREKARALLTLHRRPVRKPRTYLIIALVAATLAVWFALSSRSRRRRARAFLAGCIAIVSLVLYIRASLRERRTRDVDPM